MNILFFLIITISLYIFSLVCAFNIGYLTSKLSGIDLILKYLDKLNNLKKETDKDSVKFLLSSAESFNSFIAEYIGLKKPKKKK